VADRTGEPDRTTSFVAINESCADVLATGIEEDWLVIRDLSGRPPYGQEWVPSGPEHRNSLAPSAAWWLVAHGDGEHVLGLGGPRTRQLVLSTLTRMPDDIHVLDLGKIAWVTALLGGYSADEQCTVARAWREVMGDVARLPN